MMAEQADGTLEPAAQPSFIARIFSRWRRDDADRRGAAAGSDAAGAAGVPTLDALTIRQWLWGPGFHIPGDAQNVLNLVKPFAANPASGILDVAAGLGGVARLIADEFGAYVSGLERDPELVRRGMEMSIAAGKAKQAAIYPMDPEAFELKTGSFDCIIGRDATYMVRDKERFIRVLILGLKPEGKLLLTDFVVEPSQAQRPELATWVALQPYKPQLWNLQQYVDCLRSLGCDDRGPVDITAELKAQIILGWYKLLQTVAIKQLPRPHQLALLDEAERWVKTIVTLDSGALKAYRFLAVAGRQPTNSARKSVT
jgi:SAM-dependent methyltransferase